MTEIQITTAWRHQALKPLDEQISISDASLYPLPAERRCHADAISSIIRRVGEISGGR